MAQDTLTSYFESLLTRVESSDEIQNDGKDANGFYLPTRTLLLRHLTLLKDLYAKPGAKQMVRGSWGFVTEHLPPDWLILDDDQKNQIRKILE